VTLQVEQRAHHEGDGWWRWAVWLTGDELDEVNLVEYTLHPTFPDPHAVVQDRDSGFRIERTGWGEFRIYLKVHLRDGSTRELAHWLELEDEGLEEEAHGTSTGSLVAGKPRSRGLGPRAPNGDLELGAEPAGYRVYLSSSLADAELADTLRDHLREEEIDVASPYDFAAGSPWEAGVSEIVRKVDAAVVLVDPERANLWTLREAELARNLGVPVIPVLLGAGDPGRLPGWMRDLKAIRGDRTAPEIVARQVWSALRAAR
jgi:hypothetical protein